MVVLNEAEYKTLYQKFYREYSRVEAYNRRPLTKNEDKLKEYKKCLVETYNNIVNLISPIFSSLELEDKLDAQNKLSDILSKFKETLRILKLHYEYDKSIFATIDINKITESIDIIPTADKDQSPSTSAKIAETPTTSALDNQNNTDSTSTEKTKSADPPIDIENTEKGYESDISDVSVETTIERTDSLDNLSEMTQTPAELIRIGNQMISYRFNGDSSALDSFIDAIELLKELCEAANLPTLIKFIMTRLEGNARRIFDKAPDNVDTIITKLRQEIKTESSKVLEGKILALRADKTSLIKFSEQAEKLAEQYCCSLFAEGFSKEKAKEITIQKTVEMCRKSAKNDTVKAVLAASSFSEPKEVIAKMIVEINNLKQDKPQSSYTHKFHNKNNGNGKNSHIGHSNNNNHNNRNNNRNSSHNNNRQNNNNTYSGRSNNNRNDQNRSNNYNNRSFNYSQQGNNQTVRHFSGNEANPGNAGLSLNQ